MTRAVSTAADVAVFCLLVTGAVLALTSTPAPDRAAPPPADDLASVLAGTTAGVEYRVEGAREREYRAHGTLAELLAAATVEGATGQRGRNVSPAGGPFGRSVERAVRDRLGGVDGGWQLVVSWDPYPGSELRGARTVGEPPPPEVPVDAARISVPTGLVLEADPVGVAREAGYAGLAEVVSKALRRRFAGGRGPLPAERSGRLRRIYGVERADGRLVDAVERQLRTASEDPVMASKDLSLGQVTVTIRRWPT